MRGVVRRSTPPVPGPEASDPAGLRQQTITLFEAFVRACEEQPAERRHDAFVAQLQAANLLKVPPTPDSFSLVCCLPGSLQLWRLRRPTIMWSAKSASLLTPAKFHCAVVCNCIDMAGYLCCM